MLGRIETRTRDRMYCQTMRTVRDISQDDCARIATCSLRTLTDRLKENYSIDEISYYVCRKSTHVAELTHGDVALQFTFGTHHRPRSNLQTTNIKSSTNLSPTIARKVDAAGRGIYSKPNPNMFPTKLVS